ncbi:MAG: saccharopine dehydrogenase [Pseudomonadota bacterium]
MTHLWLRAEERPNERRVALMPGGVADLRAVGLRVTVEDSAERVVPIGDFAAAGADVAARGSWRGAPSEAIVLGLKELPDDGTPLTHRHIMFGHAYKGQPAGQRLLAQFVEGGGTLLDLEYLTDPDGRRLAAFGHWAGYTGAGVSLLAWVAQARGEICPPVDVWSAEQALLADAQEAMIRLGTARPRPRVLIVGAKGRVGGGASAFCRHLGLDQTLWDVAETAHGGPFPEVLAHDIFLNCILAAPGAPVFVPAAAKAAQRTLRVIGDIACDPTSEFSPIKVYDAVTDWASPARRVADAPPLDVMAIDNLPSLLPAESSADFAQQLLPLLAELPAWEAAPDAPGPWARAAATFARHTGA